MRKGLLLALGIAGFAAAKAQVVANYNFKHESGQLLEVDQYPNAVIINHGVQDDILSQEKVAFPFIFRFGGQVMDSVGVNENGYLWFGRTRGWDMPSAWPISAPHTSSVKGIISAVGTDLFPVNSLTRPTMIRTAVVGTAPMRILIVEFKHASRFDPANDATGPDDMNFQFKLYETTNRVEIAYGAMTLNANFTEDAEVGLRGAAFTDYSNRVPVTANNWANTKAGTRQDARVPLNGASKPGYGDLYVWEPGNTTSVPLKNLSAEIRIYPVPATAQLYVQDAKQLFMNAAYNIHDMTGKLVASGVHSGQAIPVHALAEGTYVLVLQSGDHQARQVFTKQN